MPGTNRRGAGHKDERHTAGHWNYTVINGAFSPKLHTTIQLGQSTSANGSHRLFLRGERDVKSYRNDCISRFISYCILQDKQWCLFPCEVWFWLNVSDENPIEKQQQPTTENHQLQSDWLSLYSQRVNLIIVMFVLRWWSVQGGSGCTQNTFNTNLINAFSDTQHE